MASFINRQAPRGWRPRIGELVEGQSGKRIYRGYVLESTKKRRRPAVFNRYGAVLLWIQVETPEGTFKKAVNEVRPAY